MPTEVAARIKTQSYGLMMLPERRAGAWLRKKRQQMLVYTKKPLLIVSLEPHWSKAGSCSDSCWNEMEHFSPKQDPKIQSRFDCLEQPNGSDRIHPIQPLAFQLPQQGNNQPTCTISSLKFVTNLYCDYHKQNVFTAHGTEQIS